MFICRNMIIWNGLWILSAAVYIIIHQTHHPIKAQSGGLRYFQSSFLVTSASFASAVNTMYFLWPSPFTQSSVALLRVSHQVRVLSKNSRLSSREGQAGHRRVIIQSCWVEGGVACKCLRMIRKMSLFIKTWHTFPPYYQAHANHPLEAIQTSFVLIRQVSDTNRRRAGINSHLPFCVPVLGLKRVR